MTEQQLQKRTRIAVKKLKKRGYYGLCYMEEAARNAVDCYVNKLASKGDDALIRYLLRRGYSIDYILTAAERVARAVAMHNYNRTIQQNSHELAVKAVKKEKKRIAEATEVYEKKKKKRRRE